MSCVGEVCHVSSKRIRLQIAEAKGNRALMARVGKRLEAIDHVTKVEANPLTGSVVLCHDCKADEVLSAVEGHAEFPVSLHFPPKPQVLSKKLKRKIKKTVHRANKMVIRSSEGTLDIPSVIGISLVGLAIYQFRHGFFLPAGMTMAILAYKAFDDDKRGP